MIKISKAEEVDNSCRRKFSFLHIALSIKDTKASIKKKNKVMNKLILTHLNQKLGFFSLTALL